MTIPKWLLPVISVVAAVAVGVAGVLIGMRLTPAVSPVLATELAPVLAPAEPQDGDTPFDVSETVGAQEIVTPGQPGIGPIDSDAQTRIDALNDAGGEEIHETASGDDPPAGSDDAVHLDGDDPCATTDPPDGCPVGVTGIVTIDDRWPAVPVLYMVADPQSTTGPSSFRCEGDTTPGNVWIDVATTVPVDLTLTYSPVDDPSDEQVVEYGTSAEDRNAWDADYAAIDGYRADSYWWFHNCIQLTGLSDDDYTITATATDIFGRVPDPVTRVFSGRGNPVEPPVLAVPLGGALLYVSVPSPDGVDAERPIIRAWVVDPNVEGTGCDGWDDNTELSSLEGQRTFRVARLWLEERNYQTNYTSRDTVVYSVPEGSQVVVCARWYSRPDHSWESWIERQRTLTVASPDIVTPTISIESVQLGRQVEPEHLRVGVSMPGGIPCGGQWIGPEAASGPGSFDVGLELCDAHTVGFDGRVVVSTGIDLGDGDWLDTASVLQLARSRCAGTCPTPAPSRYLVDLAAVRTGSSLCSGDGCIPPTTSTSAGRVVLLVTWDQGNVNNATRWSISGVSNEVPGDTEAVAPQLDINNYGDYTHSPDGWETRISVPIEVDRDAHYRATLSGFCFPAGFVNTPITGDVRAATGARATWNGLCTTGNYFVTIELWDDAGNRQTYAYNEAGVGRWPGGVVVVLPEQIDVTARLYTGPESPNHHQYGIDYVEASLGGAGAIDLTGGERCVAAQTTPQPLTGTGSLAQQRTYHVTITTHAFTWLNGFSPFGGPERQCGFERIDQGRVVFSGDFTYEQLMRGVSLSGDGIWAPDGAEVAAWRSGIVLQGTSS